MKLLVTGARGFVGFAVGEAAARRGWEVWGIGRAAQAPEGWLGRYDWADVAHTDLTPLINRFEPDLIFHGAGAASVGQSFEAPLDDLRASVHTFASVLDAVRRSTKRPIVIFPSSAAVYGNPVRLPISEEDPTKPISPYGFHKLQCETLATEYAQCFGLKVIVCRLFSLFGPRQKRLLVWELYQQFVGEQPFVQFQGTGEETRDYLPADEAAKAMLDAAARATEMQNDRTYVLNVASGEETSVMSLARLVGNTLGSRKPIRAGMASRVGDPARWRANVTKLGSIAPNRPNAVLAEGLSRCIGGFSGSPGCFTE